MSKLWRRGSTSGAMEAPEPGKRGSIRQLRPLQKSSSFLAPSSLRGSSPQVEEKGGAVAMVTASKAGREGPLGLLVSSGLSLSHSCCTPLTGSPSAGEALELSLAGAHGHGVHKKKHKKHKKKHKKKHHQEEEAGPAQPSPAKPQLKLKIKLGGQVLGTKR